MFFEYYKSEVYNDFFHRVKNVILKYLVVGSFFKFNLIGKNLFFFFTHFFLYEMLETIFFINAIVVVEMKLECLLCSIQSASVQLLKRHYISYHQVDENDYCFKELFSPDTIEKNFCGETFKSCRVKKNHVSLPLR